MTKMLDAEDIQLFAQTTGQLYDEHCRLAKNGAGIERWFGHVQDVVLPRYIREVLKPKRTTTAVMVASREAMRVAARSLRAYYLQHIKEL
jgi:hypothetical protein